MSAPKPRRGRTYHELVELRDQLMFAEERYLRSHGWRHTSDTPGCLWMWVKATPKGEVIMTDVRTALAMQSHSCAIRGNDW